MRKLHIGIVDIVSKGPTRALYARLMNPNLASIMPQVIGVWCREEGHDVSFVCYTGFEDLLKELPANVDLVFIGAFTEAAQTAYALSNLFRSQGRHHRDRRASRPLLPGRRAAVLRLRPRLYRQGDASRCLVGTAPSIGRLACTSRPGSSRNRFPAYASAGRSSNPRSRKRRRPQNRSHARQPGVSVYVQLLHRCGRALSAHGFRRHGGGPHVPAEEVQAARGGLARSQFRRPLRRLHGRD